MRTVKDGRPWEASLTDGAPNLGSYEFAAAVASADLAHDALQRAGADMAGLSPAAPTALAHLLLGISDRVQVRARRHAIISHKAAERASEGVDVTREHVADIEAWVDGLNLLDRSGGSHTRARGAVRTAIDAFPLPHDPDLDDLDDWATRVEHRAHGLLRIGHDLCYGHASDRTRDQSLKELAAELADAPRTTTPPGA